MSLAQISKFMSLILRHKPQAIGIELDEHGWADVEELIAGISKSHPFNMEMLEQIVESAKTVGKRHGKPVIYRVLSADMQKEGYVFYLSKNGVWLTKKVPIKYLEKQKNP